MELEGNISFKGTYSFKVGRLSVSMLVKIALIDIDNLALLCLVSDIVEPCTVYLWHLCIILSCHSLKVGQLSVTMLIEIALICYLLLICYFAH